MHVNLTKSNDKWQDRLFTWTVKKMLKWGWVTLKVTVTMPEQPKSEETDLRSLEFLHRRVVRAKKNVYVSLEDLKNWSTDYENVLRDHLGTDHPEYKLAYQEAEIAMLASEEAKKDWENSQSKFNTMHPKQ